MLLDKESRILPFEIKSAETHSSDFRQNLKKFLSYANLVDGGIVNKVKLGQKRSDGVELMSWSDFLLN